MIRWLSIPLLWLWLVGCTATETGNPGARPEIAPERVEGEVLADDPMLPSPPMIVVRGGAGSVDPPEGRVLGWGVESAGPPSTADVDADGGFTLFAVAVELEMIRLVIEAPDGTRSLPFDVRVSSVDGLLAVTPENGCLAVEPRELAVALPREGEAIIVMTNGCPEPVVRAAAVLRSEEPAFTLTDDGPLTIAPTESSTVRVAFDGPPDGAPEDIVRIAIEAPTPELRAISIVTE